MDRGGTGVSRAGYRVTQPVTPNPAPGQNSGGRPDWKSSRITTRNTAYSTIHFWNPGIQILGQLLSQITLNFVRYKLEPFFLQK